MCSEVTLGQLIYLRRISHVSSTDGCCFQPSLGVAHVVVRNLFPPQTLHSVHVYEIPLGRIKGRMVTFLVALLMFCFSNSLVFTILILVRVVSALLSAFAVWRFRVKRSSDDDVRKNSLVGWLRRCRRTCTLFERVKDFNSFHTGRVPLDDLVDDRISLNSRLDEGRVSRFTRSHNTA